MNKDKINKESQGIETARDKGVNSTDLLYWMTTNYKQNKIIIDYNVNFFSGSRQTYKLRLQKLIELIEFHIKESFQKDKITIKN